MNVEYDRVGKIALAQVIALWKESRQGNYNTPWGIVIPEIYLMAIHYHFSFSHL